MKKLFLILTAVVLTANAFAQTPEKMSYQSVIRDANNELIKEQSVGMQISILHGATPVYVETQQPTTNTNGLVSIEIGAGAVVSGTLADIDWSDGPYFIKTEADPNGGTNYSISGTSQLLSVPYALHAKTADTVTGMLTVEADPVYSNSEAAKITATDITNLSNLSGVNTGDQDISGIARNTTAIQDTAARIRADFPKFPSGTKAGDILYWDGSKWNMQAIGTQGQVLTVCGGQLVWTTNGLCPGTAGSISSLNCGSATTTGTLTSGVAAANVSSSIPYSGGNSGPHNGQVVSSTGINGLTATLAAGSFVLGAGNLTYTITGTPASSGTANFALNIGGQSCVLSVAVSSSPFACGTSTVTFTYKGSQVTYGTVESKTGKCWLDRNLGASQTATAVNDDKSYGDYFQWGRGDDGHQDPKSAISSTQSTADNPGHGDLIVVSQTDWRNPKNDALWQGSTGINNPCPDGFHVPTKEEWDAETATWGIPPDMNKGFSSALKLPAAGFRRTSGASAGAIGVPGTGGRYWSSSVTGVDVYSVTTAATSVNTAAPNSRRNAFSVRCIKD